MEKGKISELGILILDDEPFVLSLCVKILKNIGCENITTANSVEQALAKLNHLQKTINIIIFDLNMPDKDGLVFMRHLAENDFMGGIVLLSGLEKRILEVAGDLAKGHDLDILGIIQKPIKLDDIKLLIENYQPKQINKKNVAQKTITEKELCTGIKNDDLQLVFQPKIRVADKKIIGTEALARWNHAERGMLGPDAFIPLAEKSGLIHSLTCAIYEKAMRQTGEWHAQGINLKVSVNISINSFVEKDFSDFLLHTTAEQGVDPSNVVLEITESQIMQNILECLEILMKLRMRKFNLSIDDFGTGHSSMAQLKRIPFNELKIDRGFVSDAAYNTSGCAILESSVELAKKLNMETVVEGVETRKEWELVELLGCDYVQGYYCAKPMPNDKLITFMNTWKGPH